jgi:hypothetical protein
LQHTPSTQLPLAHAAPIRQESPLSPSGMQVRVTGLHHMPPPQLSAVHAGPQLVASAQAPSGHGIVIPVQRPAASQARVV